LLSGLGFGAGVVVVVAAAVEFVDPPEMILPRFGLHSTSGELDMADH
jgi:hypothetical protein